MINLKYNIFISTNVGKVRTKNEDNFIVNSAIRPADKEKLNLRGLATPEPVLCGVFDGMGGESNGELASRLCAEEAQELFKSIQETVEFTDEFIDVFVANANLKVVSEIENTLKRRGGSTFAMVYIEDAVVSPYSLGDSRIYLYRDNQLLQISQDHTLAMKKYNANIYTLEEALASPDSHKLTSFIGVDTEDQGLVSAKYEKIHLMSNDKILICSDGLYDMCTNTEIAEIMAEDSDTISGDLVKAALRNGGVDNITCLVIEAI